MCSSDGNPSPSLFYPTDPYCSILYHTLLYHFFNHFIPTPTPYLPLRKIVTSPLDLPDILIPTETRASLGICYACRSSRSPESHSH